jgi:hypothetical protein
VVRDRAIVERLDRLVVVGRERRARIGAWIRAVVMTAPAPVVVVDPSGLHARAAPLVATMLIGRRQRAFPVVEADVVVVVDPVVVVDTIGRRVGVRIRNLGFVVGIGTAGHGSQYRAAIPDLPVLPTEIDHPICRHRRRKSTSGTRSAETLALDCASRKSDHE